MDACLDVNSVESYRLFLEIKSLPQFRFTGRQATFPDEYAAKLGMKADAPKVNFYRPIKGMFDYQREIARIAIRKGKFAIFAECGLGKTLPAFEFVRHSLNSLPDNRAMLWVSPLMVIGQTVNEAKRFYGTKLPIEIVRAHGLQKWLESGESRFGITNYEAIRDGLAAGRLGGLVLDESSMLKSHYGKWGTRLIELGRGLNYKLCLTGTPAPNDRIEYANHAVFLDHFPTVNSFLARYFVNRGQTQNRWELKPHALRPFYRALSHWCIFLNNPATYGWSDNAGGPPPIHIHFHEIDLTETQRDLALAETKSLFPEVSGGFVNRCRMAQISKGSNRGERIATNKPGIIRGLVESWPDESTLIWCRFNDEQDRLAAEIPDAASISGDTPDEARAEIVSQFQAGKIKTLISKPKILGFGLNLQICTRMIFSSLHDSFEEYHQAIKRANRYGSTSPLNVHIPLTDLERPMVDNVLRKAAMVQSDSNEQEKLFREVGYAF